MTREEREQAQTDTIPREAVKDVSYDGGDNWWVKNMREQIKAQADGEYISRQAVNILIDELARAISDERCCMSRGRSTATIMRDILHLPPVKPQEPKEVFYSGDGYADGEMVYDMAECMNCGREFEYGDETWGCKFCPDCGQALKWESEDK